MSILHAHRPSIKSQEIFADAISDDELERRLWTFLGRRFPWLRTLSTLNGLPVISDRDRAIFIACAVDPMIREIVKSVLSGEADEEVRQ